MLRSGIALLALSGVARANPAGIVPSTANGNYVDVRLDYDYEVDTASIERERVGDPSLDPLAPLNTVRDLRFRQERNTITPRIDIGGYADTWLYVALPIVVSQSRELTLDSGVDRATSSTVADGLVPATGFDAQHPGTPTSGDLLFRGVNRYGLDQIHVGLAVAPMNQVRDDTKPTWKLGVELRVPIGKVMKLDAMNPSSETGVGSGVDELRLWTSFDRRLGWAEPWLELWWMAPFDHTSESLFQDPGAGSTNTQKSQQAGASFGFEAYAIDDTKSRNRVSLDLSARAIAHFEGREYSEMWEVFAYAGDLRMPMSPLGLGTGSYPGISNVENYVELAARASIRAELGPHVRFAAFGELVKRTDHAISFANAGIDRDGDGIVNPPTDPVNPLYVPLIDLVGHRYLVTDSFAYVLGVQGIVLF